MTNLRTDVNEISKLLEDVLKSRNLSDNTKKTYIYHIKQVFALMNSDEKSMEFHSAAKLLLSNMEERNLSKSTIIQARAAICATINAISDAENNYRDWRPSKRKSKRKNQKIPTTSDIIALQNAAITPLEKAILSTAIATGLRKTELLNLKISDLHRDSMQIYIRNGKGCKDRVIPFPILLRKILVEYYRAVHPIDFLFCNPLTKKQLTSAQIDRIWRIIKTRAKIKDIKGIHSLRHYFASKLLDLGVNITTLQHLLGHSHIQTTMIYLHMSTNMTQSASDSMDILIKI